jgi:glycosyltransferase
MVKNKSMKISIITATYNSYPNILSTIESIQSQTYNDIEFIVVDGGSSDGTLKVIEDCPLVSRFISEPDNGIYDALNKGVQMSTGDIIGFLHSDDVFSNSKILESIIDNFKRELADGVYGDLCYVEKENINKIIRNWKSCDFKISLLKKGWMPAHPTLFLKKEIYQNYGQFNTSYKISADYDFMLRILKDKLLKFAYLPKVITKMRVGGASNRNLKNIIIKTKEDYRAVRSNNIGGWFSVALKNMSKIKQFNI